jgi:hypothetical protein
MVFMIAELTLTVVANAYFQVLDEAPATGSYRAYRSTGGPWDASLQLGGPPNALRQARVGQTPTGWCWRREAKGIRSRYPTHR